MKYLIDATNLSYIVFFSSGIDENNYNEIEKQGMFYNIFLNKFYGFLKACSSKDMVFCWDSKTGTRWRREVFPMYKSNRKKPKDKPELRVLYNTLMPNIRKLLSYFPITEIIYDKGEADDVIFSLCDVYKDEDKLTIITTDGDLSQLYLYYDNVTVYNPIKKKIIDKPDNNFIKLKAIVGDKSDNIPGVYRVGIKNAPKYINGEKTFTEEQIEDYNKFLKIIDLNEFLYKDDCKNFCKKILNEKTIEFKPDNVEKFMIDYDMDEHLKRWIFKKEDIFKEL